jgi:hypothetical protein
MYIVVQSGHHHHLIKLLLVLPWYIYSWKITQLVLNNSLHPHWVSWYFEMLCQSSKIKITWSICVHIHVYINFCAINICILQLELKFTGRDWNPMGNES